MAPRGLGRGRPAKFGAMKSTLLTVLLSVAAITAAAQPAPPSSANGNGGDTALVAARDALRKGDKPRLAALARTLATAGHPLAMWAEYWELGTRLGEAQQAELDAFYARWPGSYVEDRLRNDWLLVLGARRDWANFRVEFPRFRMNDDRDVSCYALMTQHLEGRDVKAAALPLWWARRDGDSGCELLGSTLAEARIFKSGDLWQGARLATEFNRTRSAAAAALLAAPGAAQSVADIARDPTRYLAVPAHVKNQRELAVLALIRLAQVDPDAAAERLDKDWARELSPEQQATAWAHVGKGAALRQQPNAHDHVARAWRARLLAVRTGHEVRWSDELLAWHVRAALRLPAADRQRWPSVARSIDAMSAEERRDAAWRYWRARATLGQAQPGPEGDVARAEATTVLTGLAAETGFYPKLAAEELGQRVAHPALPAPLQAGESAAAASHPGLTRALQMIALGLRSEGVREWNFSLRGMNDRELIAASQRACEAEVWDRCINTSERAKGEVNIAQRFPTPHREAVLSMAREVGVDPAFVYGLVRQESRFIMDTKSHVGASGLMQLMPATARWTAARVGMAYSNTMINDRDVNLRLGTTYLKLVLEDFAGHQAMAAAAYNAGPSRPRRWREGPAVEAAAWAESIPFNETRDYVKKVLSNAVDYALVLAGDAAASGTAPAGGVLKQRLGPPVAPRDPAAPSASRELP
jgi:soluble lytic murein transglycosylase